MARDERQRTRDAAAEGGDALTRRDFLRAAKKWSKVVLVGALAGSALAAPREAEAYRRSWVNRRGGGGWYNRYRGGGWLNRYGGGWINRWGGWVNRRGYWVNYYYF
jgi:hypothetical protein